MGMENTKEKELCWPQFHAFQNSLFDYYQVEISAEAVGELLFRNRLLLPKVTFTCVACSVDTPFSFRASGFIVRVFDFNLLFMQLHLSMSSFSLKDILYVLLTL